MRMDEIYIRRIGIGTVQFGMNYGINNKAGKVPKDEVYQILSYALKVGIDLLDTASGYGEAESVLGSFDKITAFKIVSKFTDKEDVEASLFMSLARLNLKNIYALLAHRFESVKNPDMLHKLKLLKERGFIQKIGVSLYYPEELEYILENNMEIDLVQLPYNAFDRRFEKYFPILSDKGIEIHSRSVFLQGLFFVKPHELDDWFEKVRDKIKSVQEYADKKGVRLSNLLLAWVLKNRFVDKVIVGVDSFKQFKENVELEGSVFEYTDFLEDLIEKDEKIIVPSLWRLKK